MSVKEDDCPQLSFPLEEKVPEEKEAEHEKHTGGKQVRCQAKSISQIPVGQVC